MKTLPLERLWTGDGYGQNDAVTHTQIKRTNTVAFYSVKNKHGIIKGYEVFVIKMRLKGQPLPGGLFEQEDREVYPSANNFGKTAWAPSTLEGAEKIYNNLINGHKAQADDTSEEVNEEVSVNPTFSGEVDGVIYFTVKQYSEKNNIPYVNANLLIKDMLEKGSVKFIGEKRLNLKGKASKIYQMA